MKQGTEKLLSSSRKILSAKIPLDKEYDNPREELVGDFSSHDLIRHSVADANVFDDPVPVTNKNDLLVLSNNDSPSSSAAEPSSSWSFSLNPFTYYRQKTDPQTKSAEAGNRVERVGRVESIDDELYAEPQGSSTPN